MDANEIKPGRFLTKDGRYAEIISQKTMGGGSISFWHGQVCACITDRCGQQNAWDVNGQDMSGNHDLDLVALAWIDASSSVQ